MSHCQRRVRQERLAKLEARRLQLDLQVNLLTEQKSTKLIHLIEELWRGLPMVKDRHDLESEAMQRPTDPRGRDRRSPRRRGAPRARR